ncbi:glyoxylase-like metal-dependent hydrolase (beta-lactamase superfamily II) [Roseiarcus fermentans]|uniref:Glyoxylase-like metal-dependent hydrolase (Beta-lactamase superfamily II) n=1 Tax=Roseiarcus fermentans TaxID=1473586 RepID=A0A366FX16_9HYPH|nr:MBL fold metallo-hydrolase [Roseiarcus fermentans]RBP18239.1 glyoxylase-like metal-dependent hydrolase (beta-lactamase superfamily II) [Roseiarcus fermentans]
MAEDKEPDLFVDPRQSPPREATRLSPLVRRLIAPNASPFTFNGTCTYILGQGAVAVLDPGPDETSHLDAILAAVAGETVATIVVTHTHRDHSALAGRLKQATGARIVGAAPFAPKGDGTGGLDSSHDRAYAPDAVLADGERFEGAGFTLEAVATPGHCANHLCFALGQEQALFSGDHVMAWSTSVIAPPDGSMGAYMASLDKVRAHGERIYWPGHGGPVTEPQRYVRALAHHRRQREVSILTALDAGAATIPELVARVYVGLDPKLVRAAGLSTLAHLEDLAERGIVAGEEADGAARWRRL